MHRTQPDSLLPIGSGDLSNNNSSRCVCSRCLAILYFLIVLFCFVFFFCSVSFFVCTGTGSWNRCVNDVDLPLLFSLYNLKKGTNRLKADIYDFQIISLMMMN